MYHFPLYDTYDYMKISYDMMLLCAVRAHKQFIYHLQIWILVLYFKLNLILIDKTGATNVRKRYEISDENRPWHRCQFLCISGPRDSQFHIIFGHSIYTHINTTLLYVYTNCSGVKFSMRWLVLICDCYIS